MARDVTGRVFGCAALHRDSQVLAELLSVAVLPDTQGTGIGARLVEACTARARAQKIRQLWLATLKPGYFSRFGFRTIPRSRLPATVLFGKVALLVRQPPGRWRDALLGREVFMMRDVAPIPPGT